MSHSTGYPYPPTKWVTPNKKSVSPSTASATTSGPESFKLGALVPGVEDKLRDVADFIESTINRSTENKGHTYQVPWARAASRLRELADVADKHFSENAVVAQPVDILIDDYVPDPSKYISHDADGVIHHTWAERSGTIVLTPETIHIMEHGSTLCNMSGLPQDWPKGHTRVAIQDYKAANCPACVTKLLHYRPGPNAKKSTP